MVALFVTWLRPRQTQISRYRFGRWLCQLLLDAENPGRVQISAAASHDSIVACTAASSCAGFSAENPAARSVQVSVRALFGLKLVIAINKAAQLILPHDLESARKIETELLLLVRAAPVDSLYRAMYSHDPDAGDLAHFVPFKPYQAIFDKVIELHRDEQPPKREDREWRELWWMLATRTALAKPLPVQGQ
jgi:hypothetical protein